MKTPILRKIDSKGKTRIWYAELFNNSYTTYSGVEGGNLISKPYLITEPKGKNTCEEQAEKDMKSKERKKHERELYSYDLSKPHPLHFIAPQLARDYTKVPHQIDWVNKEYVAQAKLDGVRTIARLVDGEVHLTSRKGKRYNVGHIHKQLKEVVFNFHPDVILDGELYIHGMELGDITHRVAHSDSSLEYHIFDIVDETLPFTERMLSAQSKVLSKITHLTHRSLYVVSSMPVVEHIITAVHNVFVKQGYEGLILRDNAALYEIGKRPLGLFKYKHFKESEFELIDIVPDSEDGCRFVLDAGNGEQFLSRPMGTNQVRANFLANKIKYIGHPVTVKYSKILASGIPEFNRVIKTDVLIRDYE